MFIPKRWPNEQALFGKHVEVLLVKHNVCLFSHHSNIDLTSEKCACRAMFVVVSLNACSFGRGLT